MTGLGGDMKSNINKNKKVKRAISVMSGFGMTKLAENSGSGEVVEGSGVVVRGGVECR